MSKAHSPAYAAVIAAALLLPSALAAQRADSSRNVALTVSGGVSLGNFQAGATWALIFAMKHRDEIVAARSAAAPETPASKLAIPGRFRLDVLTGASAGNANAIIAATEYCSAAPVVTPEASLFWAAWNEMGHEQLMEGVPDTASPSVFNRATVQQVWKKLETKLRVDGVREGCEPVVGITVTKVVADTIKLLDGLTAPVQRHASVFQLVRHGNGLAFAIPRRTHVVARGMHDLLLLDPSSADPRAARRPYARLDGGRVEIPSSRVLALAEASGAFPFAFAPRELVYNKLETLRWSTDTTAPPCLLRATPAADCREPERQWFVDGGLFDNRPLGLALALADAVDSISIKDKLHLTAVRDAHRSALAFLNSSACTGSQAARNRVALALNAVAAMDSAAPRDSSVADSTALLARAAIRAEVAGQVLASILAGDGMNRACIDSVSRVLTPPAPGRRNPRLMYYIDDEGRRGHQEHTVVLNKDVPPGGIAGGASLLLRIFGTGQSQELRSFAARLDDDGRLRDSTLRLDATTRFAPLMGEHLMHFGAFLAPTFRSYDFYVGVYDGLRSAFRTLYCDNLRGNADAVRACEAEWLRIVLDNHLIRPSPQGEALIRRLLEREEMGNAAPALARRSAPAEYVMLTLADANAEARYRRKAECAPQSVREIPLCTEQLLPILEKWRELLDDGTLEDWERYVCRGPARDDDACNLVGDPRGTYGVMLLNILTRARQAEWVLRKQGATAVPVPAGALLYLHRTYSERFRSCGGSSNLSCFDVNPSSADVVAGSPVYTVATRLIPQTATVMRNGQARWLGWNPTWFAYRHSGLATSFGLMLPVEAGWIEQPGRATVNRLGVGGSLLVIPSLPMLSSLSVGYIGSTETHPVLDVTAAFIHGVVRIGWRGQPKGWDHFDARALTLGVGDVNGIGSRLGTLTGRAISSIWR